MSTIDNSDADRDLTRFGGRVPNPLRDELSKLYERGYSQADIFAEGIRALSDAEGIWRRRREFRFGTLNPPKDEAVPSEEKACPA